MAAKANDENKNIRFYVKVQDTPKEAQKAFNNGRFSGTDINPMWRIKKLTEVFGPAGFGWWTKNVTYDFVSSEETKEVAVFCELELYVKDPETGEVSQPIYGVGGNTFVAQRRSGAQSSDEAKKMAYTDALSIACKALGFSHDIYFQADRTKYSAADIGNEPAKPAVDLTGIIAQIDTLVKKQTEGMQKEDKIKYANEKIAPIIGSINYKVCKDPAKLEQLKNSLESAA